MDQLSSSNGTVVVIFLTDFDFVTLLTLCLSYNMLMEKKTNP